MEKDEKPPVIRLVLKEPVDRKHVDRFIREAGILRQLGFIVGDIIVEMIEEAEKDPEESVESKQRLARSINAQLRARGLTAVHPETQEPCNVVAINDRGVGRFVLEHPKTKKRSHTTKSIRDLLPLTLTQLATEA